MKALRLGRPLRWLVFIGLAITTATFWLQICDLVYDCGCRGFWAGAAEHCNIHSQPASSPHRCPWCVSPLAGGASFIGTMGWMSISLLVRWPARFASASRLQEALTRIAAASVSIPVFVFGVGWMSGALMGYWS